MSRMTGRSRRSRRLQTGGVGGDIAAMIIEEAFEDLDGPVGSICGKDTPVPYNLELEEVCVPTVEETIEGVLKIA